MYAIYRNGQHVGDHPKDDMYRIVASFNAADQVMVYYMPWRAAA